MTAVANANLPLSYHRAFLERDFLNSSCRAYGAFTAHGRLIGLVFGSLEEPRPPIPVLQRFGLCPSKMFLVKILAVDKPFRRQQIGRRLMNTILEQLESCPNLRFGTQAIYLQVMSENLGAIALYESLGFVIVTLIPQYYSTHPRRDAYVMVRVLGNDSVHNKCQRANVQLGPITYEYLCNY
ncbi:uncharacterized protein LOC111270646 isoform X1 [Varroa jacobsoni]|nr:uncharacterized protein LOC111270646 isoform X1 [Varroa jacobsoni]